MIDGTEKPKIPLKFAKREARYKNLATSRDFLGRFFADRITWKLTLQDINTTPKELKTERDCSPRQLFRPLWSSSVWRNNQRKLFGVFKTNVAIFRVISFYASWKFLLWLGNSAWDFLGDKFWSSDFLGFCLKPKGFLGVLIFPPFDHPCHLKSGVPPMGLSYWKGRWIFHTFHPKLIYIFLIRNCVGESNEKTKSS